MTDDQLDPYVTACVKSILCTKRDYFTPTELGARYKPLRALSEPEKFRVMVLLCKRHEVAVVIGPHGGFQFYPRHAAPTGAFNIADRPKTAGEVLTLAMEMTHAT